MFVVPRGSRGRADVRGHGSGWCIALMRMVLIDNLPKVQTTSAIMAVFRWFLSRWSAF